jgi:hypothetical protein
MLLLETACKTMLYDSLVARVKTGEGREGRGGAISLMLCSPCCMQEPVLSTDALQIQISKIHESETDTSFSS